MSNLNNTNIKNKYIKDFELFESKLNGQSKSYLHSLRKTAIEKFKSVEFPTLKDEEWKYTNVKPILQTEFTPAVNIGSVSIDTDKAEKSLYKGFDFYKMVFVNGIFNPELSDLTGIPEGTIIKNMNDLSESELAMVKKYIENIGEEDNAFNILNKAFSFDGAVIALPENIVLDKPVQILYLSGHDTQSVLSSPRNLIIGGKNSQAKIIINYQPLFDTKYFTNVVTDVFADENAIIDFYKIQNESEKAFHIDKIDITQKSKSVVSNFSLSFGGALVRNDINVLLDDEYIENHLYGLYLATDTQHVDNHTFIDHAKPNCESNELYKGILDEKARGIFSGKILVRKDAQKTNAFQSNKSVLLSDSATVDAKPQLEIYADDVKCSHGATVGQLDMTAYFYILSRGIPADLAKSMLIRAFANDVIEPIKIEALKEQLNHQILQHLHSKDF